MAQLGASSWLQKSGHAGGMTLRIPDTFIIGAPKSGTTSLHAYLQEHPQVFMSRFKEPGYFAPEVARPRRTFKYPEDRADYLALFANAGEEFRVGESSTNYLVSPGAPERLRELQPEPYLIAMVRNPVDLLYSLHGQRVSDGTEAIVDFEEAIAADEDRRKGQRMPPGLSGVGVAYRDNAMLGAQLDRWMSVFPVHRFHVIIYEDFALNTESQYVKVLAFLGLDQSHRPTTFQVYNASHRQRRDVVARLFRNRPARWTATTLLPAVIGDRATNRLGRRIGRRRFTHRAYERPPLGDAVRQRLEVEFTDDVAKLGQITGRNLTREWFERPAAHVRQE